MILYHYTSKAAFDEIMRTRNIFPSDPWTTMDASFGRGWYFTDLSPDNCNAWTIAHCWRSIAVFSKVEYFLKFDIPEDILIRCRDHVHMINSWDNRIKYLEGQINKKCGKGACILCDVIGKVRQFLGLR